MTRLQHSWLSASLLPDKKSCRFKVWAPLKKEMYLCIKDDRIVRMLKDEWGYFSVTVPDVSSNCQYFFSPDGSTRYADPASNFQPQGVHGCSQLVDHSAFQWTDHEWKGRSFQDFVIYELHVGTFTSEGTFEAIIPKLNDLHDCGVNAIELMPVSQFPGNRNWGYDGVFPYAVQNSYGGPAGLKELVNACHGYGIAVILDVVYNHVGPEGNRLANFGPYFTEQYRTPWGDAINFDQEWSDGVREYFANNALYWFEYFHIDGLRLDAVHMVFDRGAVSFWQYLGEKVAALSEGSGKTLYLIAESDLNSPVIVNAPAIGGYGFRAQWLDDFHHALYVKLDKKGKDRYEDFGSMAQLAKAYNEGFVHSGEYVKFRKRKHGTSSAGISGDRFVAFTSNHDQIGNRPDGGRLASLIDFERVKLAAAALILSPYVPMLFMGEEYGETNPFFYFISHGDPKLIEAVRNGRREEFRSFKTQGEWPDPQDEETFNRSVLNWDLRRNGRGAILVEWHKTLLQLRRELPALRNFRKNDIDAIPVSESVLLLFRRDQNQTSLIIGAFNFGESEAEVAIPYPGNFRKILDSHDRRWANHEGKSLTSDFVQGQKLRLSAAAVCLYEKVM